MRVPEDALGGLSVAISALQFGGTVVLGKIATDGGLPVPAMLALRFGTAALLLAMILAVSGQPLRPAPGEGVRLFALGAVAYSAESALFFFALENGTASAVTLLFFTYPVMVAVASALVGRGRPGPLVAGALAASVLGSALVVGSSGNLGITGAGVGFVLGSAGIFTLYLLAAESVLRRTSSLTGAMWVSGSASVGLLVFAIIGGAGRLPVGAGEWAPVLGMGGLTAGAFLGLFIGLRRLGAVRTAIIAALEPAAATGLAVVFLGEVLRSGALAGGALILTGAVAASLARKLPEEPAASP
jgi:drug/metabolite transporter (DMT)-like permease